MRNRLRFAPWPVAAGVWFLIAAWGFAWLQGAEVEVAALVRQLGSPSASKRADAERALLELGPEILTELPQTSAKPEVQLRLNRIRVQLQRRVSEQSLEVSTVRFGECATLEQRLDALRTQTGNRVESRVEPVPGIEPPVGTEPETGTEPLTFWAAVDGLCDRWSLAPAGLGDGELGFQLVKSFRTTPRSAGENGAVAYFGPFRAEVLKVTQTSLLENRTCSAQVQVELAWEPRVRPIYAELRVENVTVAQPDAEPQRFAPARPMVNEMLIGPRDFRTVLDVPLMPQVGACRGVMEVSGTLDAVVAGNWEDFEFDRLGERVDRDFTPVSHRRAAVLVTLDRLRRETLPDADGKPQTFLIATLRYRYEESFGAMESHRTWVYDNPAKLVRAGDTGDVLASERSEILRQTTQELAVDVYFPLASDRVGDWDGWKLVFPRPCGLYQVRYPFRLRDVPLP